MNSRSKKEIQTTQLCNSGDDESLWKVIDLTPRVGLNWKIDVQLSLFKFFHYMAFFTMLPSCILSITHPLICKFCNDVERCRFCLQITDYC